MQHLIWGGSFPWRVSLRLFSFFPSLYLLYLLAVVRVCLRVSAVVYDTLSSKAIEWMGLWCWFRVPGFYFYFYRWLISVPSFFCQVLSVGVFRRDELHVGVQRVI